MLSRIASTSNLDDYLGGTILLYLPLTYGYLWLGNAILVMKFVPALLLGLFGWSAYLLGRRLLTWNYRRALVFALLVSLNFVALRISWDLHRNMLGLALVLLTLALLAGKKTARTYVAASALASLAVMTHESSGALIVLIGSVYLLTQGRFRVAKGWLLFLPAGLLLVFQLLSGRGLGAQVQETSPTQNLLASLAYNLGFFLFAFGFLIVLALVGLKPSLDRHLRVWALASLIFGLTPNIGFNTGPPNRWILLLVVPLIVLFVQGINVLSSQRGVMKQRLGRVTITIFLLVIIVMSSSYLGLHRTLQEYFGLAPEYRALMPTSLVESTISINDVPSFITIANWTNATLSQQSVLILPFQLYGWYLATITNYQVTGLLSLDQTKDLDDILSHIRPRSGPSVVFARTVDLYVPKDRFVLVALSNEIASRFGKNIYVVWWEPEEQGIGLGHLPEDFVTVFVSGKLAVFLFTRR